MKTTIISVVNRGLWPVVFIALFLIAPRVSAKEPRADLTIVTALGTKRVLTENDFRQLHLDSVVVEDPVYNKKKRYAGYWLSDILALADVHSGPDSVWTFLAIDGYRASIAVSDILRFGVKAFVAIADLDKEEGWEKIQQGKEWVSPGPYYLVWQTPLEDAVPNVKLPWPYQVIEISVHKIDETQQKLFPASNDKSESVRRGYKVFQQNCVSCHSLNLEGGLVGPELNVPKNILEYQDRKFLKEFIDSPSSFMARSRMPDFSSTLTPRDLDDVLDYLSWMGKHKV